jgi:putative heme-binding domain-containing protein
VLLAVALPFAVSGDGLSPKDALRALRVADGLEVHRFAGEPDVCQPLTMSFDDRGRLWVIQYLQYPIPAGLKPVQVDQYLRTKYDRLPGPPPRGPIGADKITILEDADGDGRADRVKHFVTGLNLASGMELGDGGVYIVQPPYLLFYPDKDGDDVPDGPPRVLLTGFGMEDAHAYANSLTWGPDGWLYGAQGSTVTAKIRGVEFQQGIWRYHPRTDRFELFAEGGGNEWGVEFDRHGNLFGAGNEPEPVIHYVQGAYYVKGFGKHGPLHNPYTFGYFQPVKHVGYLGDSLSGGTVIYQGGAFPERYRNACISPHTRHSAVRWATIHRSGSTFTTRFAGDFLTSANKCFRPVDQTVGPDGNLYVADWYDVNISHSDPRDRSKWYVPQRKDGRIYRVSAKGVPYRAEKFDLTKRSSDALVDLLAHPNDWYARRARRLLGERRDPSVYPRLRRLLFEGKDDALALQALWALYVSGGFDHDTAAKAMEHRADYVRAWAVRLLGDERKVPADLFPRLVTLARIDPSPVVRCQLACTGKRLPEPDCLALVSELVKWSEDADDTVIPLLLWWAVEDKAVSHRERVLRQFTNGEAWKLPLVRDVVLERLARRYAAEGTEPGFRSLARLLESAPAVNDALALVRGIDQQFSGQLFAKAPAPLGCVLDRLWKLRPIDPALARVMLRLGDARAYGYALRQAADRQSPAVARATFIELLGETRREDALPVLLGVLRQADAEAIHQAACSALQHYQQPAVASTLLELYPRMKPALQGRTLELLCRRKVWARALLRFVDKGDIPPRAVSAEQVRQLLGHKDPEVAALVRKHWGDVRPATAREKQLRIAAVRQVLDRGRGNAARGKARFAKHCGTCHTLHGEGNRVGPDLTTADRKDRAALLLNVIDPSAIIRQEYWAYTATMRDGRVVTGLIAEATPATVTFLDGNNRRTTLAREQVEELTPSPQSLMPEGILDALGEQELCDLFSYLQTDVRPPEAHTRP